MKAMTKICAIAAMLAMCAMPAQAQGLGGILKKAKKAVEKVTGQPATSSTSSSAEQADLAKTALPKIPIASGGYLINPLHKVMDVELVGCYGISKTVNFGDVYLVLKVKMNTVVSRIGIGNSAGRAGKAMAVDSDGNQYFIGNDASANVVEGMFVRINLNDQKYKQYFENVPKKVTTLPLIKLGFYVDAGNREFLEFRDVPIQWGVDPDKKL
jgi:hypothetical protein